MAACLPFRLMRFLAFQFDLLSSRSSESCDARHSKARSKPSLCLRYEKNITFFDRELCRSLHPRLLCPLWVKSRHFAMSG